MLKRLLSCCVLLVCFIFSSFADDECPAGQTEYKYIPVEYEYAALPSEYEQLEYIESDGTQYIDTRQMFEFGDEFYFEYLQTEQTESVSSEHKGYGAGTNLPTNICGGGRSIGTMYVCGNNYSYTPRLDRARAFNRRYIEHWKITKGKLEATLKEVGDMRTYTLTATDDTLTDGYTSGNSIFLFRDNVYTFPSASRIYRTWLKRQDGSYAFNMIPVKRNDGAIGMYDTVTNTEFGNAGVGTFIAGPKKEYYTADPNNFACIACPYNTYKPNIGNEACTPCPVGTFSPIGSTSLDQCGHILHVGDYIAFMPVGKRTEHGLCTMLGGVKYCADLYERQ